MSNNNTLLFKINSILETQSTIESNFPQQFEHMSNIKLNIKNNYNLKIIVKYNDKFEESQKIDFEIRTIDKNKNIILRPMKLIGRSHIELLENNGPFIIKR